MCVLSRPSAVPDARLATLPEVAGCEAKLRMEGDKPYVTDNSNFIVDLYFQVGVGFGACSIRPVSLSGLFSSQQPPITHHHLHPTTSPTHKQTPIKDSHAASKAILDLEGVVDHGLFLDMVDVCIIAGGNGVEVQERKK
jgi:ribose 5-phosphate isomerase A